MNVCVQKRAKFLWIRDQDSPIMCVRCCMLHTARSVMGANYEEALPAGHPPARRRHKCNSVCIDIVLALHATIHCLPIFFQMNSPWIHHPNHRRSQLDSSVRVVQYHYYKFGVGEFMDILARMIAKSRGKRAREHKSGALSFCGGHCPSYPWWVFEGLFFDDGLISPSSKILVYIE